MGVFQDMLAGIASLVARNVDPTASGTITILNSTPGGTATVGSAIEIDLQGRDTLTVQVVSGGTGVLSIQVTRNGVNWVTLAGPASLTNYATSAVSATIPSATAGIWQVGVGGMLKARVTALAAVGGTYAINLGAVDGNGYVALDAPIPAGSNTIGNVGGTVAISSIIGGTGATNLTKAEDGTHTSGDVGIPAFGVRNDNAATDMTGATGRYGTLSIDQKGAIFTRERPVTANAPVAVAASTTAATIAANAARRGGSIKALHATGVMYINLGGTATSALFTIDLAPGGYYEIPLGYVGAISILLSTGTANAVFTELV